MPTAKKIILKDEGNTGQFANNFKKLVNGDPIYLVNGDNWFWLDADYAGFELGYLYLAHKMDVNLNLEIFRSACYSGDDTAYAVGIPGGSQTMTKQFPEVTSTDFNISVYGGDRIWLKVIAAGLPKPGEGGEPLAKLDTLCLMIKR